MWKINPFNYMRRPADAIQVGTLKIGGDQPIRIQSMANTDTNDIESSVSQAIRIIDAGGELVRFTAQGIREAENLKLIHDSLREKNYHTPLVADIHFAPNAADVAACNVEKVRVNPGNYVKSVKALGDTSNYSDEEFRLEYENIRERFLRLLAICKENNTAIRIGVNHGSLSERMMNRYGDTSLGMVESCMEFLKICIENDFRNVVISMKASNTVFMVQATRLLVDRMLKENMSFPLHLGVTEAGDSEDGRIKSAVGIGALLVDGIGDTIRVSLSEDPEAEIPVAKQLVKHVSERKNQTFIDAKISPRYFPFEYKRRKTTAVKNIGNENVPVVISSVKSNYKIQPDYFLQLGKVIDNKGAEYNIYTLDNLEETEKDTNELIFLSITLNNLNIYLLDYIKKKSNFVILLNTAAENTIGEQRAFFHTLLDADCDVPVVICQKYYENDLQELQIKAACDIGVLLIDGFGDGLLLENEGNITVEEVNSIAFGILQAARVRTTKTEYISCPSCGRTLFDLQTVNARIKAATSHLTGLKIGIMGCIVNGPGEMADADYGYVGTGRGKVSLYKKKECVERNIPEEDALDKLIELIKQNGDWHNNCNK